MTAWVRVNVLVEGQTEETFVRDVLAAPMGAKGIYLSARRVATGHRHGVNFKGGLTTYAKTKRDIQHWLSEDRGAYLTTMFDLYGLSPDFPGRRGIRQTAPPLDKVRRIETAMSREIGSHRFIPHLQLHEFEALLFCDVLSIDSVLKPHSPRSKLKDLEKIRRKFRTPEDIDDGVTTAPSKRLATLYPAYQKVAFGPRIAELIGLDRIRRECPHFSEWISTLEALPSRSDR